MMDLDLHDLVKDFRSGRKKVIEAIRGIADKVDEHSKNCKVVKAGGTSGSVVAAVMTIVGCAISGPAAPVVAGVGFGVGAVCGVLTGGTALVKITLTTQKKKELRKLIENDKKNLESLCKKLEDKIISHGITALMVGKNSKDLFDFISKSCGGQFTKIITDNNQFLGKAAGKMIVAGNSDELLSIASGLTPATAKNVLSTGAKVNIALNSVLLAYNVYDLTNTIYKLIKKKGSKAGAAIREIAKTLEEEMP